MPNSFLTNYFGFNKQQRNGLFVLLLISLLLLIIRLSYPLLITPDDIVLLDLPVIEKKLDSSYRSSRTFTKSYSKEETFSGKRFVFDPNTVSFEQLVQLGLKEKTAQGLINFRNKGFIFKEKKDLQKVYGIGTKLFSQLEPYIMIEKQAAKQNFKAKSETKNKEDITIEKHPLKIELNAADSSDLVALNGIGETFAKRILKYRKLLGGYTNVEQLKEVYGFNNELYEKLKDNFYVDTKTLKKINLNKDDFKVINKHPYLSFEITKTIFDWRRKTVINPVNLKDIMPDQELYTKLLPYLVFE